MTLLKHRLASFGEEKRVSSITASDTAPPAMAIQLNWRNLLRVHRYAHYVLLLEEFVASWSMEKGESDRAHALAQGELAGALLETLLVHGMLDVESAVEGAALALWSRRANAVMYACALHDVAPAEVPFSGSHALALYAQWGALLERLRALCAQLQRMRFIDECGLGCSGQRTSPPVRSALIPSTTTSATSLFPPLPSPLLSTLEACVLPLHTWPLPLTLLRTLLELISSLLFS